MDITKHTPGPWTNLNGAIHGEDMRDNCALARVSALYDEHDANARLIAAAPDMLAALGSLLRHVERNGVNGPHPAVEAARVAIAKARGE